MHVPAAFRQCSSKREKFLFENQCRSRRSRRSSSFARVCVRERSNTTHIYFLARVYQFVWNVWNVWNAVVFITLFFLFIWNVSGTDLERDDES